MSNERRLAACLQLLEETGDIDRCLRDYPDLEKELRTHVATLESLSLPDLVSPATAELRSRQLVLTSLDQDTRGKSMLAGFISGKTAAAFAVVILMGVGTLGASAAPGPVNNVLSRVGFVEKAPTTDGEENDAKDNHGQNVSQKVHDAIASTTPGPGRGAAVSNAACEAAHDRSTLPAGAQNALGQQDKTPHPCPHASETATIVGSTATAVPATPTVAATSTPVPTATTAPISTATAVATAAITSQQVAPGNSGNHSNSGNNSGNTGNNVNKGGPPTPSTSNGQQGNGGVNSNGNGNGGNSNNGSGTGNGNSNRPTTAGPPSQPRR